MVISQILGGLGNQMFQYAAGRACSLESNCDLFLDLRRFDQYKLHQGFEIKKIFTAPVRVVSDYDVRRMLGWRADVSIINILSHFRSPLLCGRRLIIEPNFNYWPGLMELSGEYYIKGYWQSEKYFKKYESEIRKDFKFTNPLMGVSAGVAERILESNSVGLHIRRGDYITDKATSKVFNFCDLDYYRRAIEYIADRVASPHFFIYSNDLIWAKDNLKLEYPSEYVEGNCGETSYVDMQLMSLCKHNIIANSTFSWWGAWLNSNLGKIVVAPQDWFCNGLNDDDLIPADWIRI